MKNTLKAELPPKQSFFGINMYYPNVSVKVISCKHFKLCEKI